LNQVEVPDAPELSLSVDEIDDDLWTRSSHFLWRHVRIDQLNLFRQKVEIDQLNLISSICLDKNLTCSDSLSKLTKPGILK
jgi:hypothetical protein